MSYQALNYITLLFLFVCSLVVLTGCKQVENTTNTGVQTLSQSLFESTVNPIFDADIGGRTCASSGCHATPGGSGGTFIIHPNAAGDPVKLAGNFASASGFANISDPAQSKLILEPLTGIFSTVGSHAGGDIFTNGDANYNAIINWVSNPVTP